MAQFIDKVGHPIRTIRTLKNSRGQTLVEYALLLVLIAIVVIATVTLVGQRTNAKFSEVSSALPQP
jgi:pilus assembly protein Flp/PilA